MTEGCFPYFWITLLLWAVSSKFWLVQWIPYKSSRSCVVFILRQITLLGILTGFYINDLRCHPPEIRFWVKICYWKWAAESEVCCSHEPLPGKRFMILSLSNSGDILRMILMSSPPGYRFIILMSSPGNLGKWELELCWVWYFGQIWLLEKSALWLLEVPYYTARLRPIHIFWISKPDTDPN